MRVQRSNQGAVLSPSNSHSWEVTTTATGITLRLWHDPVDNASGKKVLEDVWILTTAEAALLGTACSGPTAASGTGI